MKAKLAAPIALLSFLAAVLSWPPQEHSQNRDDCTMFTLLPCTDYEEALLFSNDETEAKGLRPLSQTWLDFKPPHLFFFGRNEGRILSKLSHCAALFLLDSSLQPLGGCTLPERTETSFGQTTARFPLK
jgi:hypothetical protein